MTTCRCFTLRVPDPFELRLVLRGHGWVSLAPHRYGDQGGAWQTVLRLGDAPVDVEVEESAGGLRAALHAHAALDARQVADAKRQLAHMLRLDEDFAEFWQRCAATPSLRWVARRGGGRLLRSASVFEDLMKLLLTTNCSWSLTETMVQSLIDHAGPAAPSGTRAFPEPGECARGEAFFRGEVRVGYRARSGAELAARFAQGELSDAQLLDPELPAATLWERLTSLHGFGPYAAGQAMRLLGHYEELALDSWCRGRLAQLLGRAQAPTERAVQRQYRHFGRWAGLALWCDLTAEWHGEGAALQRTRKSARGWW